MLKRGFAYVGWDVKLNRGATAAPPSAAKVLEFLTKAVTKIEVKDGYNRRGGGWTHFYSPPLASSSKTVAGRS